MPPLLLLLLLELLLHPARHLILVSFLEVSSVLIFSSLMREA